MITLQEAETMLAEYTARIEQERFLHGETVDEFLARVRTVKGTYRKRPKQREGVTTVTVVGKAPVVEKKLRSRRTKINSSKYVFTESQMKIAMQALENNDKQQ